MVDGLAGDLRRRFEGMLLDPARYARRVRDECAAFPEGDLFPWTFPVAGFVNATLVNPARAAADRARCEILLEPAIAVTARRLGIAADGWNRLTDYGGEGTYAGQLALALAGYRRIGGARWSDVHARLCEVLGRALEDRKGLPILSFPGLCWPFDSIPALVALLLRESERGGDPSGGALRAHRDWIDGPGTDPDLGLPWSQVEVETGRGCVAPRGCDLPWRFLLLSHVDHPWAASGYRRFARHFWRELFVLAGFAEWPAGREGGEDADSGPVLMGIGLSATGFGLAAAICFDDGSRARRLQGELAARHLLFPLVRRRLERRSPFRGDWLTGLLMGDAALFGTLGTQSWAGPALPAGA